MEPCFSPMIWPEDELPEDATSYKKCELCGPKSRIIWGEGTPKAPIFIILDNPGAREDKDGIEYVCGTRQTLQAALHDVNLGVKDVYLTFLLKCRPLHRYDKENARAFSKPFLIRQIESAQPKFIVCLGDTIVKTMFENDNANVRDLRGAWHLLFGHPCIVSYHPLAVRRRPNLMRQFLEDWSTLAQRMQFEQVVVPAGSNKSD